jgi:hypothetical protein
MSKSATMAFAVWTGGKKGRFVTVLVAPPVSIRPPPAFPLATLCGQVGAAKPHVSPRGLATETPEVDSL